ncbi:hypothetical protein DICPUDRAFT_98311 [Dictyostelium purpureum]|uniref:Translation initiation factor IF-2, chloroplastic n=1 Tax=Dictyostelium purpureum TaxID=5786 RepID=F0ZPE1_DICPU|nr:uncharacterized protein DICPUDRAFT_98311 [Dictyostelium purpureum]EGC34186.1 hypothetical protein DICPUDRAFT_98311 [Dictyostelium purpureum]|eukprot:XP_003289290.1 hypothetical protein DICPUDRAFT_98311 [Dictyostelium purpureum]
MLRANLYLKNAPNSKLNKHTICFYTTEQRNINPKNNNVPLFDQIDLEKISNNSNVNNSKKESKDDTNKTNEKQNFSFFLNYKPKKQSQTQIPQIPQIPNKSQPSPQPPQSQLFNLPPINLPPINLPPKAQQQQQQQQQQPKQQPNNPFPFNMFKTPNNPNLNNNNNNNTNNNNTNINTGTANNDTNVKPNNPFLEYLKSNTSNNDAKQSDPFGFAKFNFASPQATAPNKFEIPKIPIKPTQPPKPMKPTILETLAQETEKIVTETKAPTVEKAAPSPNIPRFDIEVKKQVKEVKETKETKEFEKKKPKELSQEDLEIKKKRDRHRRMIENFDPIFRVYKPIRNEYGEEQKLSVKEIVLPDTVTVENLAPLIGQSMKELIKWQIKAMLKPTSRYEPIEDDILQLMAQDYLFEASRYQDRDVVLQSSSKELKEKPDPSWPSRPPIVTVVGHIDHDKEAGRITQHIGAFEVKCSGKNITFMDTPGHAAFATMRERGVSMTDIALLIVAGDDGVQEQTIEAIKAIKKSGSQMVVAINKMDKPGIDANLIRYELAEHGVNCEGIGGEVPCVEISAKTGLGVDKLKETIILLSDIMELKAPTKDVQPSGVVIESTFKKNRGTFSTILVQKGVLKQGDWFICGESYGKVKEMRNPTGAVIKEGKPGQPVEIFGFKEGSPNPNDELFVFKTQKEVDELIEIRKEKRIRSDTQIEMNKMAYGNQEPTAEEIEEQEAADEEELHDGVKKKFVKFYVKGDVTGSAEALVTMLGTLPKDPEIYSKIKKVGYGEVTETDIKDATFMNTPIIYFGSKLNQKILDSTKRSGVHVIQSDIIYHVFENVKEYLEGLLEPTVVYNVTGEAKVSKVFHINNNKDTVAGSVVESGILKKGSRIKIFRDGEVVYDDRIELIKHFKETVKEVTKGQECGITLRDFNDLKENDKILAYTPGQEKRKLGHFVKSRLVYNK